MYSYKAIYIIKDLLINNKSRRKEKKKKIVMQHQMPHSWDQAQKIDLLLEKAK